MKRIGKLWLFLIITFLLSLISAGVFKALGYDFIGVSAMIFGALYMFIPLISVLIVEKGIYNEAIIRPLNISFKLNWWFAIAVLIPLVLAFLSVGISLLIPGVSYSPDMEGMIKRYQEILSPEQIEGMRMSLKMMPIHPIWLTMLQGVIAGVTINAVAAFGEELGWRGFLIKEFKGWSYVKASLMIGIIWGIWHAPIILMGHNYPQHPQIGVAMMVVFCVLLSFLLTYITLKSRSVIAAAIMHGTLNGTAGIGFMLLDGGNDLTVGVTGVAGFMGILILIGILYAYDRWISKEKMFSKPLEQF